MPENHSAILSLVKKKCCGLHVIVIILFNNPLVQIDPVWIRKPACRPRPLLQHRRGGDFPVLSRTISRWQPALSRHHQSGNHPFTLITHIKIEIDKSKCNPDSYKTTHQLMAGVSFCNNNKHASARATSLAVVKRPPPESPQKRA